MQIDKGREHLLELVFIGEIVKQAKIAKRAGERMEAKYEDFNELDIWSSIQTILVAAGNVSKILWPSRRSSIPRGRKLRELLSIDNKSVLSSRKFRNHFEHYDERIEDWFETNRSVVYIDSSINPFESIWGPNINVYHRAYNPSTKVLTFRDETVDLAEILDALEDLRAKCRPFALP